MIMPAQVFDAIADPTRRAILDLMACGERSAGEIAAEFPVSRPAISRHIRVLREAGLVRERREAQSRLYTLNAEPLRAVDRWLDRYKVFWAARLHALRDVAEAQARTTSSAPRVARRARTPGTRTPEQR